jgi:hypothetical protein
LFGLDYFHDPKHIWQVPDVPEVALSKEVEILLDRMHGATFWQRDSAEALSRTFIDIMLFDRLEANQADAARNFQIRGERPISAKNVTETMVISGKADYVLGYNHPTDSGKPGFESCSVVVEAKKRNTFHEGLAQTVAYMVGVQQDRRKLRRIVDTVYGMLADGTSWQFLRLDGKRLLISESYDSLVERNLPLINRFIDSVIRAAVSSSPHTTPNPRFPSTKIGKVEGPRETVRTYKSGCLVGAEFTTRPQPKGINE